MRGVTVDGEPVDRIVYARLANDPPAHEPEGFRALLNSFLPRKRAISQMLVRDHDGRVLLCRLTYKQDWDLPGGVVEVGESPQLAVTREVEEELALADPGRPAAAHRLAAAVERLGRRAVPGLRRRRARRLASLDDVVRQEREIRDAAFCTLDEVRERCADFTARRIEAALGNLDGDVAGVHRERAPTDRIPAGRRDGLDIAHTSAGGVGMAEAQSRADRAQGRGDRVRRRARHRARVDVAGVLAGRDHRGGHRARGHQRAGHPAGVVRADGRSSPRRSSTSTGWTPTVAPRSAG